MIYIRNGKKNRQLYNVPCCALQAKFQYAIQVADLVCDLDQVTNQVCDLDSIMECGLKPAALNHWSHTPECWGWMTSSLIEGLWHRLSKRVALQWRACYCFSLVRNLSDGSFSESEEAFSCKYGLCIFCQSHRPTSSGSGILSKASEHGLTTVKQAANTQEKLRDSKILMWSTILKRCWIHLKPKVCCGTKRATYFTDKIKLERLQKSQAQAADSEPEASCSDTGGRHSLWTRL